MEFRTLQSAESQHQTGEQEQAAKLFAGSLALGPLAGTSMAAAGDMVISEFGDQLHLPHLPQRGLGSDAVGYSAALLESLSVDRGARSWQLSARPQRWSWFLKDLRERDIDVLEETWQHAGQEIKLQVMGPVSLASQIELADGHRVLSDRSALFDLADALAVGIANFRADMTRRFSATTVLQIDEPYLTQCVRGEIRGATDYHKIAPLDPDDFAALLARCSEGPVEYLNVSETDHDTLHQVIADAVADNKQQASVSNSGGVREIIIDQHQLTGTAKLDQLAELIDAGVRVGLACVPPDLIWDDQGENPRRLAVRIARLLDTLGIERLAGSRLIDICPQPGIPGKTILDCARTYRLSREVARMLAEDIGDL
ncbi:hypothetical protein M3B03_01230 [Corynebacterium pseudodiphtheriticum]|uniref:hypothetical protein n=1 Tax=Corynebacterium pseudodiphtheriticum TaxID=37637 RepID=UPI00223B803F|nr:hypothetical protein [Corynebacterium pseudodiphtheriticum]MCT1634328.1 hypothetical protein [Corynebacterium pseudodiphtheriticum]MCT1665423.1 hypothetical protein [Corynebacterium pseudodiphtheriticum]